MIPASSILLILSAAGAERFTRRPSSLWVSLALPCNSSRMRHPVLSRSLSFSALIPENTFVSGYRFAKHILQAIPKTRFSVCNRGVSPWQIRTTRRFELDATESRAGERLAVPALAAAGVLWGVSFLFGKWALEEMGPHTLRSYVSP